MIYLLDKYDRITAKIEQIMKLKMYRWSLFHKIIRNGIFITSLKMYISIENKPN